MMEHVNEAKKRIVALFALLMTLVMIIGFIPASNASAAPSAASKKAEAEAALAQLNELEEALDAASNDYYTALEAQEEAEAQVEQAEKEIQEETAHIKELQSQLGDRARSMYRSGTTSFLDVILGAASFEEFANNFAMLDTINQKDAAMVAETKEAKAKLEAAKTTYEEQAKVASEQAAEAKKVRDQAAAAESKMATIYNNLSDEAAQLLEEEQAAEAAAAAAAADPEENGGPDEGADAADPEEASSHSSNNNSSSNSSNSSSNNSSSNSGSSTNNSKPQSVSGNKVIARAESQIGKPYKWGAVGPDSYDCSGFVSYCLTGQHTRLGTTYTFMGWTQVSNPKPGDVCVNYSHCGIYAGGGQMIHAPSSGKTVCYAPVKSNMIYVRY